MLLTYLPAVRGRWKKKLDTKKKISRKKTSINNIMGGLRLAEIVTYTT